MKKKLSNYLLHLIMQLNFNDRCSIIITLSLPSSNYNEKVVLPQIVSLWPIWWPKTGGHLWGPETLPPRNNNVPPPASSSALVPTTLLPPGAARPIDVMFFQKHNPSRGEEQQHCLMQDVFFVARARRVAPQKPPKRPQRKPPPPPPPPPPPQEQQGAKPAAPALTESLYAVRPPGAVKANSASSDSGVGSHPTAAWIFNVDHWPRGHVSGD